MAFKLAHIASVVSVVLRIPVKITEKFFSNFFSEFFVEKQTMNYAAVWVLEPQKMNRIMELVVTCSLRWRPRKLTTKSDYNNYRLVRFFPQNPDALFRPKTVSEPAQSLIDILQWSKILKKFNVKISKYFQHLSIAVLIISIPITKYFLN